ncbi:PTS sugar transporter subunit IIA [Oceanivirga salmonicida]|uniref:PTS sugar transporter subunit IIA n=1 Tax=Oceanivirga salmonicida TaxID=1769291 RepID=UPI00082B7B26|nr:PTS sugar transporter subunit IIA [Oceanivirga salmonicida]
MFSKELIFLDYEFLDSNDFFKFISSKLEELGIVKESYLNSILEREKSFPTGIETKFGINIAIPHTVCTHTNKEVIAITRLSKPLKFYSIENDNKLLDVKLIFNLLVVNPDNQIKFLMSFMKIFQDYNLLKFLMIEKDIDKIIEKLNVFIERER